jgi:outer membrane immunogenic protein
MTASKSVLFGVAIGLLSAVGANAADLPSPPTAPPIYIPPPTFTWAGPYLGGTAG